MQIILAYTSAQPLIITFYRGGEYNKKKNLIHFKQFSQRIQRYRNFTDIRNLHLARNLIDNRV